MTVDGAQRVLGQITGEVDTLFRSLRPVAAGFARLARLSGPIVREDLIDLRGVIADVLSRDEGFVAGAGVIPTPHRLADAPYWMEWWCAVPERDPELLRVNLEPSAPDFFDYTTADWFVTPQLTGEPHVAGPYVDYVCTNEYSTTLALPVEARGEFVGIAALDVTISGWETRLLPMLRSLPEEATLTNSAGRVIASTSPLLFPGQRLRSGVIGAQSARSMSFGWHLVTDESAHIAA